MSKSAQTPKNVEILDNSNENALSVQNTPVAMVMDDSSTSDNIMKSMDLGSYCSMKPSTREGKIKLYNAVSNPKFRLGDMINEVISINDISVEIVEIENEKTGNIDRAPRIVMIDDKGEGYVCVSFGVMNSLKRIFKMLGEPHWDEAVKIKIRQINKDDKRLLTLELV